MAQRILKIGVADFLTGIAPSAHIPNTGLFYEAEGVTPFFDIDAAGSAENGLLRAGPAATDFTTNIVDTVIAHVVTNFSGTPELYMLGGSGHFYKKGLGAGAATDLRSATPITNPEGGMVVWGPAGGTTYLYYLNNAKIGTWDLSGTYPTGWNDSVYTSSSISYLNTSIHKFVGNVYYGGSGAIGAIIDNGDTTASHSSNVLDFDPRAIASGLTDDGRYLVLAITTNLVGGNLSSACKIYFWDTFSDSWNVEYEIKDPYIWALKSIGGVVYAFGQHGIYQVTFAGGVKKIFSRQIANYGSFYDGIATNDIAAIFNNSVLMWGNTNTSSVDTFGKMSPEVPSAYFQQFNIASGNIRHIIPDFDPGRVYVSTDTPKLYGFDFNNTTRETGVTPQTVFFELDQPADIVAVRVVFGAPLAVGDQLSVSVFSDEATAAKSFGSIAYTATRTTRSKTKRAKLHAEDQFSLQLSFDAGAPKVKKVEVFAVFRNRID